MGGATYNLFGSQAESFAVNVRALVVSPLLQRQFLCRSGSCRIAIILRWCARRRIVPDATVAADSAPAAAATWTDQKYPSDSPAGTQQSPRNYRINDGGDRLLSTFHSTQNGIWNGKDRQFRFRTSSRPCWWWNPSFRAWLSGIRGCATGTTSRRIASVASPSSSSPSPPRGAWRWCRGRSSRPPTAAAPAGTTPSSWWSDTQHPCHKSIQVQSIPLNQFPEMESNKSLSSRNRREAEQIRFETRGSINQSINLISRVDWDWNIETRIVEKGNGYHL